MNKRNILKKTAIIVVLLTAMMPAMAQVFIDGDREELSPRSADASEKEWIILPTQGLNIDQYACTPVGGGVLLLTALAGIYATAKRRKSGK